MVTKHTALVPYGLIWIAHIGMDGALGFGLKYETRVVTLILTACKPCLFRVFRSSEIAIALSVNNPLLNSIWRFVPRMKTGVAD